MRARARRSMALGASVVVVLAAGCATHSTMPMHGRDARGLGGSVPSVPSVPSMPSGMGSTPPGYRLHASTCAAPAALPGALVRVMLGDMGMTRMMRGVAPVGSHMMLRAVPVRVRAGQVSFVVANMGWREHEMVVLPLPPGGVAGERVPSSGGRVDEAGSLGEASASCAAGAGDGIEPGAVGWLTLNLGPGRYELVCNLPHHYASGMREAFVVG